MASRRHAVLAAVRERLETIQIADGFNTDAGLKVFLGQTPLLGEDDPEAAIAIVVGDDRVKWQGLKGFIQLPIEVQALAHADLEEPWLTVEALLEDIKRAVESADRHLAGYPIERESTRTLPRETGSMVIGAAVPYLVTYAECWGAP